jgi:hypothetical protein
MLQFENVVDCLHCVYPQFDYYFIFNHSNGQDGLRPDGLNMNKIHKNFGGTQPLMRDTVVSQDNFHNKMIRINYINCNSKLKLIKNNDW